MNDKFKSIIDYVVYAENVRSGFSGYVCVSDEPTYNGRFKVTFSPRINDPNIYSSSEIILCEGEIDFVKKHCLRKEDVDGFYFEIQKRVMFTEKLNLKPKI